MITEEEWVVVIDPEKRLFHNMKVLGKDGSTVGHPCLISTSQHYGIF